MEVFFLILEYLGVAAFAVSGAMVAIDKEADFVGVIIMALVTTFGGGVMRDLFLGINPPNFFTSYMPLIITAALAAVATFTVAALFKKKYVANEKKIDAIINVFDALGLGIFVVYSTLIALDLNFNEPFVAISMGVIGAVGGGIVRDLMLGSIPFVIRKRIYLIACLAGSLSFYLLYVVLHFDVVWATFVGVMLTFLLRMCATIFKWNMPKAIVFSKLNEEQSKTEK